MVKKSELTFEIVEHIATIEEFGSGYARELNLVSWNGGEPKYDIRNWSADHTKPSSGITLFDYELEKITKAYKKHKKAK